MINVGRLDEGGGGTRAKKEEIVWGEGVGSEVEGGKVGRWARA